MARRCLILFLMCSSILIGQTELNEGPYYEYIESDVEKKPFDREAWNKAKNGIDYSDIDVKKKKEDQVQRVSLELKEKKSFVKKEKEALSPFLNFLFYFILIIAGIAILGLILSQLISGGGFGFQKNRNIEGEEINYDVAQVEERLIESDLERMIRLAEEAEDFKLALRLQYLAGVKSLATNSHINWKKAKTNRTYLREIQNLKIKEQFGENILIYERIWFGDTELDRENYQELKPIFQTFNRDVV